MTYTEQTKEEARILMRLLATLQIWVEHYELAGGESEKTARNAAKVAIMEAHKNLRFL